MDVTETLINFVGPCMIYKFVAKTLMRASHLQSARYFAQDMQFFDTFLANIARFWDHLGPNLI